MLQRQKIPDFVHSYKLWSTQASRCFNIWINKMLDTSNNFSQHWIQSCNPHFLWMQHAMDRKHLREWGEMPTSDFEEWIKEVNNFRQGFNKMDSPAQDISMVDNLAEWSVQDHNKGMLQPHDEQQLSWWDCNIRMNNSQFGKDQLLRFQQRRNNKPLMGCTEFHFPTTFFCDVSTICSNQGAVLKHNMVHQHASLLHVTSRPWALQQSEPNRQKCAYATGCNFSIYAYLLFHIFIYLFIYVWDFFWYLFK